MKTNEIIEGSDEEKNFILNYLNKVRQHPPPNLCELKNLKQILSESLIDSMLFENIIDHFNIALKKITNNYSAIEHERYLVGSSHLDNIGGFYGTPVGGFLYFNNIGHSYLLNNKLIKNKEVITFEFARNYIHDCIHSSTFRSFKKTPVQLNSENPIYRYQYGFNYRNAEGIPYSSVTLTQKSPLGINLNLLMDGANQIYIQNQFKIILKKINIKVKSPLETELINEIIGAPYDSTIFSLPDVFYNEVIFPTLDFINFWDNGFLLENILRGMFTGDESELREYFSKRIKKPHAWELLFKQIKFT